MSEDRPMEEPDWVDIVANKRCDQCGLQLNLMGRLGFGPSLLAAARLWADLLTRSDLDLLRLRRRPQPDRWSALECGAHARDVLVVLGRRVALAISHDGAEFEWWDHDASVVEERYNDQDPAAVAEVLLANAAAFVDGLPKTIDSPEWDHSGGRPDGARFTIDGLARYALHEIHHHRIDALAALESAP